MTSRRKQARNSKQFHQYQLRSEGEALKKGTMRRQRRLARRQMRRDDATLATALSSVSVDEALTGNGSSGSPPVIGAPIVPVDKDVKMACSGGRIRKPRKKDRVRRAKLLKRMSVRTAMSITKPGSSPTKAKSVRFKLDAGTPQPSDTKPVDVNVNVNVLTLTAPAATTPVAITPYPDSIGSDYDNNKNSNNNNLIATSATMMR